MPPTPLFLRTDPPCRAGRAPRAAVPPGACASAARPQVRLQAVDKSFSHRRSSRRVFRGLELTLPLDRPSLLFGPNGSGKSTLLRLLAGLVTPDAGRITFEAPAGCAPRPRLLYAGAGPGALGGRMTVRENLDWFATMGAYDVLPGRADELLQAFGLADRADDLVESLSRGQQQKVLLVRALSCRAQVVLLDEPTEYLDEEAVQVLLHALTHRVAAGDGAVVATHDGRLRALPGRCCFRAAAGGFDPEAEDARA